MGMSRKFLAPFRLKIVIEIVVSEEYLGLTYNGTLDGTCDLVITKSGLDWIS